MHKKLLPGLLMLLLMLLLVAPAYGEDFIPGDGTIAEKDILSRIEKELGEDLTPAQKKVRTRSLPTQTTPKEKEQRVFFLRLRLENKSVVSGRVFLAQKELVLHERSKGEAVRHRIPISDIRSLKFENWKPVRSVFQNGMMREYFAPTVCVVTEKNGHLHSGSCRVTEWLQINMINGNTYSHHRNYFTRSKKKGEKPVKKTEEDAKRFRGVKPIDTTVIAVDFENGTKTEQEETRSAVRSEKVENSR